MNIGDWFAANHHRWRPDCPVWWVIQQYTSQHSRQSEKGREMIMTSYTLEFNGTGEVSEGYFARESEAIGWVESVLEARGYDVAELATGDWDADGLNADDQPMERMLFWESEESAENDPGVNSIAKLCRIAQ